MVVIFVTVILQLVKLQTITKKYENDYCVAILRLVAVPNNNILGNIMVTGSNLEP